MVFWDHWTRFVPNEACKIFLCIQTFWNWQLFVLVLCEWYFPIRPYNNSFPWLYIFLPNLRSFGAPVLPKDAWEPSDKFSHQSHRNLGKWMLWRHLECLKSLSRSLRLDSYRFFPHTNAWSIALKHQTEQNCNAWHIPKGRLERWCPLSLFSY